MNLVSKNLIDLLVSAAETMRMDIYQAMQNYRTTIETETKVAARFKDEEGYLQGVRSKQGEITRGAVERATRLFKGKAKDIADRMESELRKHLHEPVNSEFREKLSMISDFNLQPEPMEIEDLITLAAGNQTALAALAKTLQKVESPYSLNYHSTADFTRDIETVRELSRNAFYIPAEFRAEGKQIFTGYPTVYTAPNGSTLGTTFDEFNIRMQSMDFESRINTVKGFADTWSADCSYGTAEQIAAREQAQQQELNRALEAEGLKPEPIEQPQTETQIDSSSSEGVRIARELGQRNAEGAKTLQKAMDTYLK